MSGVLYTVALIRVIWSSLAVTFAVWFILIFVTIFLRAIKGQDSYATSERTSPEIPRDSGQMVSYVCCVIIIFKLYIQCSVRRK